LPGVCKIRYYGIIPQEGARTVQGFFEELRKSVERKWQEVLEHPFLVELARGTLPREKFFYYLSQDDHYLEDMLATLGILVAKASTRDLRRFAVRLLHETVQGEIALHELLEKEEGFIPFPPGDVTLQYGDFLLRTALTAGPFEVLVALAPCFVSYRDIGLRYVGKLCDCTPLIYRAFVESYAGEAYGSLVEDFLAFLEEEAPRASSWQKEEAFAVFSRATHYEWLFWEKSYRFSEEDGCGEDSQEGSADPTDQTHGG
jgi:thiaminase/transcriptional activator TenA